MASGSTGNPSRPATRPRPTRLSCPAISPPALRGSPASMASRPSSAARAGCTTMPACGWRPTWCTGGGCAGRPGPAGSCSTCSMATPPATTSAGSGWPAASATSPTSSTAPTWSASVPGGTAWDVRRPTPAVRSRRVTRRCRPVCSGRWIPRRLPAHHPLARPLQPRISQLTRGPCHPAGPWSGCMARPWGLPIRPCVPIPVLRPCSCSMQS